LRFASEMLPKRYKMIFCKKIVRALFSHLSKNLLTLALAYDIMKSDVNFTLNTVFSEEIYLEEPDEAPLGRGHFADRR
jgi:hypothetical protein